MLSIDRAQMQSGDDKPKRDCHWLKPYQFKKGQSGNPGGKKKGTGKSVQRILEEALHDKEMQVAYTLAEKLLDIAKHGEAKDSLAAIEKIMQRVYGNVAKRQEIKVDGPTKLVQLMDGEDEDGEG